MACELRFALEHVALEPIHELLEGVELFAAGVRLLEIANEANADGS